MLSQRTERFFVIATWTTLLFIFLLAAWRSGPGVSRAPLGACCPCSSTDDAGAVMSSGGTDDMVAGGKGLR